VSVVRSLVVWCPDWPVVAAGLPLDVPVAVLRANRVVACSPAALAEGVTVHQRRRDAQARCPELMVVDHDPDLDGRAFEPVAFALEALTPRVEITHPGAVTFPTRGPSRYHGGDRALAARAANLATGALPSGAAVRVGVADGPFAAALAARAGMPPWAGERGDEAPVTDDRARVIVVPPGETPAFLAPLPLDTLDRPDLVDVMARLGVRTLGDLAALDVGDVVGRFGAEGLVAHRLASGLDERPPAMAPPPPDLTVAAELDPPVDRVEPAAFVARGLADDLHRRLAGRGSACTRLAIGAETEHGEQHERLWRTEGAFTVAAIADRVRWQLEGWLHLGAHRPTGGLSRLWLAPDEVVPAGGRQLAFGTGAPGAVDAVEAGERVARSLARVQGLVGFDAVRVPEWRGGRGPGERVALVPAGAVDVTGERPAAATGWVTEPWPGVLPEPSPAAVHAVPVPAEVRDDADRSVVVVGRGTPSGAPTTLVVSGGSPIEVAAWAGPWPYDERWWDPGGHRRCARLQVLTADGVARLLVLEGGRWAVEATYD
jgi:protein ImuB